ncbi:MAG: class E sortase [Solirubrobacteraceae bacterium]
MRRRLLLDASSVLLISGLLLLLDAGLTLVWQEPLTAAIGMIKQSQVDNRFLSYQSAPLSPADRQALAALPLRAMGRRIAYLARLEQHRVPTGYAVGTIAISKISKSYSYSIIQGTDTSSLEKGPGHYPATAFPGLGQTIGVAGHRTTYLAPFKKINELSPGDRIVVKMPYAQFTYVVQYTKIVVPTALWVVNNVGYERLVLSACNPLYSAAQRIIVFARLQKGGVVPRGAALTGA